MTDSRTSTLSAVVLWTSLLAQVSVLPSRAQSQSVSANFKITKEVLDSGGQPSQSTSFRMRDSFGFPITTGRMASATLRLQDGFFSAELKGTASISGRVRDYNGQDPVVGARVVMSGEASTETTTDDEGRFTLSGVPIGGTQQITPRFPGMYFQPATREYAPLSGDLTEQDFTGSLYGDVSGNDDVTSFDASLVLRYVVGLVSFQESERDSTSADVSGDGSVRAFDASLILRHAAGIITEFPADKTEVPGVMARTQPNPLLIVRLQGGRPASSGRLAVPVVLECSHEIHSIELEISYSPSVLKFVDIQPSESAADFQVVYAVDGDQIRIAMAATRGVQPSGAFLELVCELAGEPDLGGTPAMAITAARSDDPVSSVKIMNEPLGSAGESAGFYLRQNYPNPFNPETIIEYRIPPPEGDTRDGSMQDGGGSQASERHVKLGIYNSLGQEVVRLVDEIQVPGEHRVTWDGRDASSQRVASGVYFCRIKVGSYNERRTMILLQ